MKRFIIILLFANLAFCQTNLLENEFVKDFIKNNTLKYGELRLISNWPMKDSLIVKKEFEKDIAKFIQEKNDSIKISNAEKNMFVRQYVKSNMAIWNSSDFENKTLSYEETLDYLKSNRDNTILLISHPIFFRNNTIALVNYTNLCCGQVYGNTGVGFFVKKDGKWVESKMISQGSY